LLGTCRLDDATAEFDICGGAKEGRREGVWIRVAMDSEGFTEYLRKIN
jgi:hypothetical protein